MWIINDLKLFSLLFDASRKVTNEEMQSAYGDFMEQVETVCQSEQDYIKVFRILNNTRVALAFLQSFYRHGEGKKCPEIRLSYKSNSVS